jgi:ABC-type dipeptide/oligopeptide/nickel transport system permease subunit
MISMVSKVVVAGAALLAPVLAPYPPLQVDFDAVRQPPSAAHWLGADQQGRDIFSRLLYGARISLAVGVVSQIPLLLIDLADSLRDASDPRASNQL